MKASLTLEDGSRALYAYGGNRSSLGGAMASEMCRQLDKVKRPWVAKITGYSDKYGYQREFINAQIDYSDANSRHSRGVRALYILESGHVYDVSNPMAKAYSDYKESRFYCTVTTSGDIKVIDKMDVNRILGLNDFIRG